jgi:hypothetical protein
MSYIESKFEVLHDGGHGVTEESLEYVESLKGKFGEVIDISIDKDREFAMEIKGINCVLLLSGVNCGYGGTGPHGTIKLLKDLGVRVANSYITDNEHCYIDCRQRSIEI